MAVRPLTRSVPAPRLPVRTAPHRALATLAAVLLTALLTGCDGSRADDDAPSGSSASAGSSASEPGAGASAEAAPSAPRFARYVAIGDSYTAAPGVTGTLSDDGCFRSTGNYPHLLAAALPVGKLVDVSCSGAGTSDVRERQLGRIEPQLDAVTRRTDLVTIGLGGNDEDLFRRLLTGCRTQASARGSCADPLDGSASSILDRIERNLVRVVRDVRTKAPAATVLLVGYPQLVPASGGCPQVPFASPVELGRKVNEGLDAAVRRAASATGATFVDIWSASAGHDLCSADPWVNGASGPGAAPFHPFAAEQAEVARLVQAALG
jgi:lysophospholipase L1-like esterase